MTLLVHTLQQKYAEAKAKGLSVRGKQCECIDNLGVLSEGFGVVE